MARVKDLSIDEVPAGARADYARYAEQFGYFSNLIPVYAHSPEGLRHIFGLSAERSRATRAASGAGCTRRTRDRCRDGSWLRRS